VILPLNEEKDRVKGRCTTGGGGDIQNQGRGEGEKTTIVTNVLSSKNWGAKGGNDKTLITGRKHESYARRTIKEKRTEELMPLAPRWVLH